jgi:aspartate carbamoyltransferase regulatory subunit
MTRQKYGGNKRRYGTKRNNKMIKKKERTTKSNKMKQRKIVKINKYWTNKKEIKRIRLVLPARFKWAINRKNGPE